MGSGGAVTSLTDLNHPHRDPMALGRIDMNADDSVNLAVSGELDMVNPEGATANRSGPSSRQVPIQGTFAYANSSLSRNSQSLLSPRGYTQPSSLRAAPLMSSDPLLPTSSYSRVDNRPETAITRRSLTRSGRIVSDRLASAREGSHFAQDGEKASPIHEFRSDSSSTATVGAASQGPFERISDPFSKLLTESFDGFGINLEMEQTCGDACSLRSLGRFESLGSKAPSSDDSTDRLHPQESQAKRGAGSGAPGHIAGTD